MRRMDRYESEETSERVSRSDKNKELYESIGKNTRYTNFTDVKNTNTIDISKLNRNERTRENYHKMREYNSIIPEPRVKKELDELKSIYKQKENKVYDINSVIAEARKNREDQESEGKRKLKNDKYNILLSMSKEELEEYRKERKEKYTHPDEDQLHELINTITTRTIAGEIDQDTSVNLLSELMATSIMDRVPEPSKADEEDLKITSPVKMNYDRDDTPEDDSDSFISELEEDINGSEEKEEAEDEKEEELKDDIEDIEKEEDNEDDVEDVKISSDQLRLLKEELDNKSKEDKEAPIKGADSDFYTRSMDLSDQDFSEEMDNDFKEKKLPLPVKIIIFLLILILIVATAYFILKML